MEAGGGRVGPFYDVRRAWTRFHRPCAHLAATSQQLINSLRSRLCSARIGSSIYFQPRGISPNFILSFIIRFHTKQRWVCLIPEEAADISGKLSARRDIA
jgi:hypothetical protein